MSTEHQVDAIVVGAGMGGLYSAYRLSGMGLSVRVIEAASGVGGTWHWNRYPGARCDIDSVDYSFSFSPELQDEWDWSERYATQPELEAYFNHVADRFHLRELIDLNTRVTHAHFNEETSEWHVGTTADSYRGRYLIMATGPLSVPYKPSISGLSSFEGRVLHSAEWPREPVDFTGRRVGVIGTGSTGIQIIPSVAPQSGHMYVFQRTPNYSVPAQNYPLTREKLAEVRASYGERRRLARNSKAGFPPRTPRISERSAMEVTPEQRREVYELMWERGGGLAFRAAFADLTTNPESNQTVAEFIREKIRQKVDLPEVAELLVPTDHAYATKRPPVDIDYYETFNRDNVTLVDVRSDPIRYITSDGVVTDERTYVIDDLILATGFDAVTGAFSKIDIRGANGVALTERWKDGPSTFLGVAVAAFPNLFIVNGPGSPAAFSNVATHTEVTVDWFTDLINYAEQQALVRVEVRREAEDEWTKHVGQVVESTLYAQADSWYLGANIPGKPRVFMFYVGGLDNYLSRCREVADGGYAEFVMHGA